MHALLPFDFLAQLLYFLAPLHVRRYGFLQVDMLFCGNRQFQVFRVKIGGRRYQDDINITGHQFVAGTGALEHLGCVYRRVPLRLVELVELRFCLVELVLKEIAQSVQSHAGPCDKCLRHARPASAATDHSELRRRISPAAERDFGRNEK